jgi:hypothetical protein
VADGVSDTLFVVDPRALTASESGPIEAPLPEEIANLVNKARFCMCAHVHRLELSVVSFSRRTKAHSR